MGQDWDRCPGPVMYKPDVAVDSLLKVEGVRLAELCYCEAGDLLIWGHVRVTPGCQSRESVGYCVILAFPIEDLEIELEQS